MNPQGKFGMQKETKTLSLLLDTHIWLWLCTGDEKLKKSPLLKTIAAAAEESQLLLSIISVWEFGVLVAKKRFPINLPPLEWAELSIKNSAVTIVELTPRIVLQPNLFLGNFHGDPADRIIVTTAVEHKAILVTQDRKILEYAAKNNIPTLSV